MSIMRQKFAPGGGVEGIHETEDHGIGTPVEATLGRVQLRKDVGRNTSMDEVLEHFESARGERDGTIGVKRSGGHHRA